MPSRGYQVEGQSIGSLRSPESGKLGVVFSIIRRIALPASGGSVTASVFFSTFFFQIGKKHAFPRLLDRWQEKHVLYGVLKAGSLRSFFQLPEGLLYRHPAEV